MPEDEATPWVQPIVAVPKKDGNVRICVNMRLPNEANKRARHPIPTVIDHIINLFWMSKVDILQPSAHMSDYLDTNV